MISFNYDLTWGVTTPVPDAPEHPFHCSREVAEVITWLVYILDVMGVVGAELSGIIITNSTQ